VRTLNRFIDNGIRDRNTVPPLVAPPLLFDGVVRTKHAPRRHLLLSFSILVAFAAPRPTSAQETQPGSLPPGWITPTPAGLLAEPALLRKLVATSESKASDEQEPADGLYVETGNMITGEGWISAGPGYRRHMLDRRLRVDASAAVSWKLYNVGQVSVEMPRLAHDRLTVGAQVMRQDLQQVDYFGLGNDSRVSDLSAYRFTNTDILGYATVQATRWLVLSGRFGGIPRSRLGAAGGPRVPVPSTVDLFSDASAPGILAPPSFLHGDVQVNVDLRDHKGHPTGGGLYQFIAATYLDRDSGTYTFRRYEVDAAQFVPLFTKRWILALHGREVFSDTTSGHVVPFYLMPSLGGKNTLRGYHDYRFHDDDMQAFSGEVRCALFTHLDVAVFADAGRWRRALATWIFKISNGPTARGFASTTRRPLSSVLTSVTASRGGRCSSRSATPSSDRCRCRAARPLFRLFHERASRESNTCLCVSAADCALLPVLHGEGPADHAAVGRAAGGALARPRRSRQS